MRGEYFMSKWAKFRLQLWGYFECLINPVCYCLSTGFPLISSFWGFSDLYCNKTAKRRQKSWEKDQWGTEKQTNNKTKNNNKTNPLHSKYSWARFKPEPLCWCYGIWVAQLISIGVFQVFHELNQPWSNPFFFFLMFYILKSNGELNS